MKNYYLQDYKCRNIKIFFKKYFYMGLKIFIHKNHKTPLLPFLHHPFS